MKHSIKKIEESKVEAVVEVEPELWKNAQKKAFDKLAGQVTVPGFRKGKAPEDMLKGKIDPNKIFDEAINDILPAVFGELVNDEKLRPFSRPEVNVTKLSDSELEIKFVITLVPEVTLGAYKDLHAEKKAPAVTDDEVNEAVKKRLEQSANLVVVDRPAKEGDTVTLDFEGFVDGKAFEGGKAENYALELGSHSFVPGFEEALVGVKSGDSKDVVVTFPKNYVENLAGKEATFKCKIHEIKEKQIPALSDETVKDMGIKDVTTVDQLKEFEKKTLLEGKVNEAQKAYYDAIVKQIRDGAKVTIAKEIIKSEAASMEDNMKKQVEQNGLTFDQYLQITGQKIEDLQAKMESDAEQNIKTYLCLEQIAEQEKLSVEDKDVDAEIEKIAKQYNMKPEEVRDVLAKNLNQFKEELRQRKIQDFILANNH
jgi:trigger factor